MRQQVLASAKSCMAKINTYDYRKLDDSEKTGAACTTGDLTAQYKTTMEKLIKPQAPKAQVHPGGPDQLAPASSRSARTARSGSC